MSTSVYSQPIWEQISKEPPNGTHVVRANSKNGLKVWSISLASLCEAAAHLPSNHLAPVATQHSHISGRELSGGMTSSPHDGWVETTTDWGRTEDEDAFKPAHPIFRFMIEFLNIKVPTNFP